MREILFKAKRKDNGEWVEGHLIQSTYMGEVRSWISSPNDKTRLRTVATYYCDWRGYEVNTDTICQYTGLTDKNGCKIWENDVVSIEHSDGQDEYRENAQVVWSEKDTGFSPFNWEYECEGCDLYCNILEVIVIGNIFDNPELLKGE